MRNYFDSRLTAQAIIIDSRQQVSSPLTFTFTVQIIWNKTTKGKEMNRIFIFIATKVNYLAALLSG